MIQLEYFPGLVSIKLKTFLGFTLMLGLYASTVGNIILSTLNSSVGRVLVSHPQDSKLNLSRCAKMYNNLLLKKLEMFLAIPR